MMAVSGPIRTRFAPSPTGYLHVGGARTALFNWLYSRRHGGAFVLRIEDTDQQRSTEESTKAIFDAMTWLGLDWDEGPGKGGPYGPYTQSERLERHREEVARLVAEGKAFWCTCTPEELEEKRKLALAEGRKPKYDGTCRERNLGPSPGAVVRFRCPDAGTTVLEDLIKGTITFNNEELDDLVIQRSDGYPTYNFAVVVDDADMRITDVIRGDDHVNNTPRQILLYRALGYPVPRFGHVPMILGADKTRLSKRHGATSVMAYQEMGYLPEAVVNYLVRLGWSSGDQEIFSSDELIRLFNLEAVGKSAAVFNPEKLLWLNAHYIKTYPLDHLTDAVLPFWAAMGISTPDRGFAEKVVSDLRTRAKTLVELAEAGRFYFGETVAYDGEAADKFLTPDVAEHLAAVAVAVPVLADFSREGIEAFLRGFVEERQVKFKAIAQPLRVALSGKAVSPGIDEMMSTLGPERVARRIGQALARIAKSV